MSVTVEGLGPLIDLATALGLVGEDGHFDTTWFASPGDHVGNMFRQRWQREALLRAADQLLAHGKPPVIDGAGRRWIEVFADGGVAVHVVFKGVGTATEIGIGARVHTTGPDSQVHAYVPLVRVPLSGPATAPFADGTGVVSVEAQINLDGPPPQPGEAGLQSILFGVDVATDGNDPKLRVMLKGLQLPGQSTPSDVNLDGTPVELEGQALRLVLGLIQRSVEGSVGPFAELLALLGITDDPGVPPLPIAELLTGGLPAWGVWLDTLLADSLAVDRWLFHLSQLVGHGANVIPPSTPGLSHRVEWTLANGLSLSFVLRNALTAEGLPTIEFGFEGQLSAGNALSGSIEFSVMLTRITLGPTPSIFGLPSLEFAGRIGPRVIAQPADRLLNLPDPSPKVGSLRAGIALDESRQVVFVLAAHDVVIGTHPYPVLDLTNTQTLADVAGNAVSDLATSVLDQLGAAGVAVRVLLGITPPVGQAGWPVPLTPVVDLLANPPAAIVAYHKRVIATNRGGYASVLDPLRQLLSPLGVNVPISGAGTEDIPWRMALTTGLPSVSIVAWEIGTRLELAVEVEASVTDLGGGCPTVRLTLLTRLASIALDGSGSHALPGISAQLAFGARGNVPLRIGDSTAALIAQRAGIALDWSAADGFEASVLLPGLSAVVDGEAVPFQLPTIAADGTFAGTVPWRALELLAGHVLIRLGPLWAREVARMVGWLPGQRAALERLSLESLTQDPVAAVKRWAAALMSSGALPELARAFALALTGPVAPGVPAGVHSGRGDFEMPLSIPLAGAASAALRIESLLWSDFIHDVEDSLRPGELLDELRARADALYPSPSGERIAAALQGAANQHYEVADLLADRRDLADGLTRLAAALANTDGLVRADDAVLPGAIAYSLDGLTHLNLASVDIAALTGIPFGAGTIIVSGVLGPQSGFGIPADHVIDLRAAGLVPEAFDLAGVSTGDGPWLVLLPTRRDAVVASGDDGAARQLARLSRVVDAVTARVAATAPVVLIGLGAAGHAATQAASRPGVTHLITLGTPHLGITLNALESQPAAGALQLLGALVPGAAEFSVEGGAIGLGRGLLAALLAAYQTPGTPLADFAPPATATAVPAGVEAHCIRGRSDAGAIAKALCALVVRGLQDIADTPGTSGSTPSEAMNLGLGVTLDPPVAAGEVHVTATLAFTGRVFGTQDARPGLRVRIGIGRAGGWLAGGPDPARPADLERHPSLRRASIELDASLGAPASARLIFHEASALGVSKRRWVVSADGTGDPLLPEARVLVGRLAAALGPVPALGPIRQLTDLLSALGLTETAAAIPVGSAASLSVDGIRRLLVDPSGLLADAVSAARVNRTAAALASFLGAQLPSTSVPTEVGLQLGAITVRADIAARTLRVEAQAMTFDAGLSLGGSVTLDTAGHVGVQFSAALGTTVTANGRPVLEVNTAPLSVQLRWEGAGNALPTAISLAPTIDTQGLARLVATVVPAQALWAGITFIRSLQQPGATALVDPLLDALGLLEGSGADARVIIPTALLADPAHWLTHDTVLGNTSQGLDAARLVSLVDVASRLLNIPQPRPGAWTLPYGIEVGATSSGGRTSIVLGIEEPLANTGLRVAGAVGLALGSSTVLAAPTVDLTLALPGAGPVSSSGRATLSLGPQGLSARLVLPHAGVDLQLLPDGPGLAAVGAAAAAAVTYALPLVLDAIADLPTTHVARPVGVALGNLGDVLGLRVAGKFSASEISALAGNPGPQLAQRLSRGIVPAFDALAALLAPAMPAGYSFARNGNDLIFAHAGAIPFSLSVTVPQGGVATGIRVSVSVSGVHPFAGASLGGSITLDETGLNSAVVTFAVDRANAIQLGPITLAPIAELAIGTSPTDGARVAAGLIVDATRSVKGVLRFTPTPAFALEATGGPLPEVLVRLAVPPALNVALAVPEVQTLLDTVVLGGPTIRQLLDHVLLVGNVFDEGVLEPANIWNRVLRLAGNIAAHTPALPIDPLTLQISRRTLAPNDFAYGIAVSLPPGKRFDLVSDGVTVQIEVDASWVRDPQGAPPPADGLVIELLRINGATPSPFFGISVRGIGVRIGKSGGKLLDTFVTLDSVAVHGLLTVATVGGVTDAGGQLELGNLGLSLGSASGGNNKVAAGVLKDSASGSEKPEPRFSPALAVQSHGGAAPTFDLRAGPDPGPWWISIQHGFGPVYIEQVGFGVSRAGDKVVAARVLVDGKVSMLGLTLAVDDLALGMRWPQTPTDPPLYDPRAWEIDLAGLAVSMSASGVSLAGGLSKGPGALPDYVGMISIRFSVYSITAYGGYGVMTDSSGEYTSLFIYGAVCAPIGGVPAFFVTGIGAGVGINRRLLLPADLNEFPRYPLLQALDRTSPMADPGTALELLRAYFPPARGAFWFAAGIAFNSFTLVDGIVVVAVAIGDGLEINLLGLAKAGLPNPSAPLVQIELALVARFSSKEGVLWIQAQLTDNSFLLTRDCRLTGGFAFVMWFKGDKKGQCVVTLGGYHPSFHRDGYPNVPRLGFVWTVSDILCIKGESYFALVSEAMMAGTRFEASLTLGPLWAYLRLGADAIVYFEPFHFEVTAFAELGAGITIDIDLGWFGHIRVTISVHLHADVLLEGPEFRGRANIDLDVTSATISFGEWVDRSTPVLTWPDFRDKYLRPSGAAMITVVPGRGVIPPSTAGSKKAATGGASDPYLLLPEFDLTITTTAATSAITARDPLPLGFPVFLAIGVMQTASVSSTLAVSVIGPDGNEYAHTLRPVPIAGQFPKAAWAAQSQSEPKPVPGAEMVEAANGVTLTSMAVPSQGTVPVDYHQVEIGKRLPLPFLAETAVRGERAIDVQAAELFVQGAPKNVDAVMNEARALLTRGANGTALSRIGAATFVAARSAPPQLVPLTHGMAVDPGAAVAVPAAPPAPPRKAADTRAHPMRVEALLTSTATATATKRVRTTVGEAGKGVPRIQAPTLADTNASLDPKLAARLLRRAPTGVAAAKTVVPAGRAASTGRAGAGGEVRRQRGQAPWRARRLDEISKALQGQGVDLVAGDFAVLTTGNGSRDIETARPSLAFTGELPVRVVVLDTVGEVTLDVIATKGSVILPKHTERVVLMGGSGHGTGAAGWHSSTQLTQVGARALIGPSCTVTSSAVVTRRGLGQVSTGFITAADAVRGYSIVTTRLPWNVTSLAVVLETAARVDDDRADALDLGLAGAQRATDPRGTPLPPRVIVAGSRMISVYAIQPDGKGAPIEVTVASGEHLHLGGVLGSENGADALAESLRRSDVAGALGGLFDAPAGKASVRWLPQTKTKARKNRS